MLETLGVVLVVFSLPGLFKPAEVVRNAESLDADGTNRSTSDPTAWKVTMTRVIAAAMLALGIGMIVA